MLVAVGLAPKDPGQQPVEGAVMIAAGLLDWYHPVFQPQRRQNPTVFIVQFTPRRSTRCHPTCSISSKKLAISSVPCEPYL